MEGWLRPYRQWLLLQRAQASSPDADGCVHNSSSKWLALCFLVLEVYGHARKQTPHT